MGSTHPPLEYLVTSSNTSLESFELSRLNAVANLRKEIRQVVDAWVEAEIEARIARWVLERRRTDMADPQLDVRQLSEPSTTRRIPQKTLQAAQKVPSLQEGYKRSPSGQDRANCVLGRQPARASGSHGITRTLAGDQTAGQQLLLDGLSYGSDLSVESATSPSTLQDERAVGALQSLERFERVETKILRRNQLDPAIHKVGLSSVCSANFPLAILANSLPTEFDSQHSSLSEGDIDATYPRPVAGWSVLAASSAAREIARCRKPARRCRHSELWSPGAPRSPMRHVQFLQSRTATAS